ncbi:MAG: carotenoid biosynthesis protein [bacterium]|nr:carotenoid biosynthesis protein [bacterium]
MKIALNEKRAGIIVLVLHFVGMIGYMIPFTKPYFIMMTPFNLLISAGLIIYLLRPINIAALIAIALIYTIGYTSEYLGVNHNLIFGDYHYGDTLGPKIGGVPLMIGVNWLILSFSFAAIANMLSNSKFLIPVLASLLMVAMDFLIEPVAISFDYWHWANEIIPISNYIGWFGVALIIQILLLRVTLEKIKVISSYIVVGQATFFISLNIYLSFI